MNNTPGILLGEETMLFRTVYGPELPAIHGFVLRNGAVARVELERWFVQTVVNSTEGANLDEAVAFLLDCGLLQMDTVNGDYLTAVPVSDFRLGLLNRLQFLARATADEGNHHPLTPWFMGVLDHCFVRPNITCIMHLHRRVNSLELPVPCSDEKVNTWRRIMEYLGCGRRVRSGFWACYSPVLVLSLLRSWETEGPLESWLRHAETFVPVFTATGDLSAAMSFPLLHLEVSGHVSLSTRGDLANRSFFGKRRVKWLVVGG